MLSTSDKKYLIFLIIVLSFVLVVQVQGFRISRPVTLKHPLDEKQVRELNNILEQIFVMQEGRYELDAETTAKTNAKNGEMWILTGVTAKIQFKVGGNLYSITPD